MEVNIIPGEKLLIKMWESLVDNGIGGLLRPFQTKREGMARIAVREAELLAMAKVESDLADVKKGIKRFEQGRVVAISHVSPVNTLLLSDGRVDPKFDIVGLVENTVDQQVAQSIKGDIAVARAIVYAEEVLIDKNQQPQDAKVDADWLEAWKSFAGKASREDAQRLWGHVLAGEFQNPGSFSIRTLDFLRGISKQEAERISVMGSFFIENRIYRLPLNGLDVFGADFDFLFEMQELGLILGSDSGGVSSTFTSNDPRGFRVVMHAHGASLGIDNDDQNKKLIIPGYLLTKLGREVMKLGNFAVNDDYLRMVAKDISSKGFQVFLGEWVSIDGTKGTLKNARLMEF